MFRGITNLSVDTKGRLAIPSRYRNSIIDASNRQIIVTVDHTDHCLLIYPMQDWINIEEQLMKLSNMNRRSRNVQRLLLGHAFECELDNQGRIRIAAPLREYAGLEKKVVLVGQLNKFELWNADTWQTERDAWITEAQSDDMEMDDALSQVSL